MAEPIPSRRALLAGAGGIAAAGALSTAAKALPACSPSPSAELVAWRKARAAYWRTIDATHEWEKSWLQEHGASHTDTATSAMYGQCVNDDAVLDALLTDATHKNLSQAWSDAERALNASVAVIMGRTIRSWHDVAELAEMVRGEMRWNPGERDEDDDNAADPNVAALFDAIAMMASKGGAHV
jgi:hypothetical protein